MGERLDCKNSGSICCATSLVYFLTPHKREFSKTCGGVIDTGRCQLSRSDRDNFTVVGREKSLFSGVLIGPKSFFCVTLIACIFEICAAHRRSLLQREAANTPRAQQYTSLLIPLTKNSMSSTTGQPPNQRHISQQVEKEAALARK